MKRVALILSLALVCSSFGGCFQRSSRMDFEQEETVEAEGWTPIDPQKPLETRERALAEAEKKAVEKVMGVTISASTKVESSITIRQEILANIGGDIRKYEILSERMEDGFLKTRIRAVIVFQRRKPNALQGSDRKGYDRIAAGIFSVAKGLRRRRIAVLQFPYIDGRACAGPKVVQEALLTRAVNYPDLQVMDGASLPQAADQITISHRGLLDSRSSYQLGKVLDVDAVLTGTLVELPNRRIQVNARLIRIPDGLILVAVEGLLKRTWTDPSALSDPRPVGRWLADSFTPVARDFHKDENLNNFIQEQFNSAEATPASVSETLPDPLIFAPFPNSIPAEGASSDLIKGRRMYEQHCTYCHGPQGKGSRALEMSGLPRKNLRLNLKSIESYSSEELIRSMTGSTTKAWSHREPLSTDDASNLLGYLRLLTASLDCTNARTRVDELEADIVDLKARHWAIQLKKSGTTVANAPRDMDSTIIAPALKAQFHDRLMELYASDDIPELTPPEVQRFVARDGEAFSLRQNCGLQVQ